MANHEGVGGSAEQQRVDVFTDEYWHHHQRCPDCLTLGQWQFLHGDYVCEKCGKRHASGSLGHWNKAFSAGVEFAKPQPQQLDDYDWKAHAALSDKEFCQMEDWLIGNADFDKDGLVNRYERCKERIRDLIAKEGELGDLKAAKPLSESEVGK